MSPIGAFDGCIVGISPFPFPNANITFQNIIHDNRTSSVLSQGKNLDLLLSDSSVVSLQFCWETGGRDDEPEGTSSELLDLVGCLNRRGLLISLLARDFVIL